MRCALCDKVTHNVLLPFRCSCGFTTGAPTAADKAKAFAAAAAREHQSGSSGRDKATIERLYTICAKCKYFANDTCILCGCRVARDGWRNKLAFSTTACPIGLWGPDAKTDATPTYPVKWITTDMLLEDAKRLLWHASQHTTIVAIGRSGLLPGSYLATCTNRPLFVFSHDGVHNACGSYRIKAASAPSSVLLIDDSAYTGNRLRTAKQAVHNLWPHAIITTAAVYARQAGLCDVAAAYMKEHLFAWHFWHSPWVSKVASDLDGVLCGFDGAALTAVTGAPLAAIITARSIEAEQPTRAWLARYGFQYRRLIMAPKLLVGEDAARYKIDTLRKLKSEGVELHWFVEDDPLQARLIGESRVCGVICVTTKEVWGVE